MAGNNRSIKSFSNLVKAVSRLSQNNTEARTSEESQVSIEDVEATIRRLFPSINGQATSSQAGQNETRAVAERVSLNAPDRRYAESTERFVPNRNYASTKKRSRYVKNASNKKPKGNELRSTLKDVILLPGPKQNKVPRGLEREALFAHGFTTTIELNAGMHESEIRSFLEEKFQKKLATCKLGIQG